ncbi:MAG: dTMP kinase [Candidatus Levybacteria bacterium RIFCSPLOWO2_01_FULL_38_21]|nr:MAG: dTMP kinase [Candidatus Levybacteria bacterium RIFCSPLOWO2_01_FULL_38_21]
MKHHVSFDIELRKNPYKGVYVAFEGIDGVGKTTQASILKKYFEDKKKKVVYTKEPTNIPPIGTLIHDFIQEKIDLPPVSVQYLFAADRAIHMKTVVEPPLQKGRIVISDRCFWSSVAYGISDKKEDLHKLKNEEILLVSESIISMYHQFIVPDVTFYINVSETTAISRLSKMRKKQEYYETAEKLKNIKAGYDWIAKKFSKEITAIDGERSQEKVTADIIGKFETLNPKS